MSASCLPNAAPITLPQDSVCDPEKPSDSARQHHSRPASPGDSRFEEIAIELIVRCWNALRKLLQARQTAKKHLRVCETATLGDKRFVAVVQVDQERFLIGCAANSIAMLARLSEPAFPSLGTQTYCERADERQ